MEDLESQSESTLNLETDDSTTPLQSNFEQKSNDGIGNEKRIQISVTWEEGEENEKIFEKVVNLHDELLGVFLSENSFTRMKLSLLILLQPELTKFGENQNVIVTNLHKYASLWVGEKNFCF